MSPAHKHTPLSVLLTSLRKLARLQTLPYQSHAGLLGFGAGSRHRCFKQAIR